MNDKCKISKKTVIIVGLVSASIIVYTIFDKEQECPYVPATQHTHQDPYRLLNIPVIAMDSTSVSATPFTLG